MITTLVASLRRRISWPFWRMTWQLRWLYYTVPSSDDNDHSIWRWSDGCTNWWSDFDRDEDFVAFLKDDMAVELIRESGGRTLNGRILRSGRLAVEYSLLFQACVELLPPLSTIFNLKGSPRVILKKSDGSRMGRWHRTKDWLVVGRLCNAVLQIKRAGIQTHPFMTISFLLREGQNCFFRHYKTSDNYFIWKGNFLRIY